MKINHTVWTLIIILLVAVIGLIIIVQSDNLTGKYYEYGSFFGPQGQKPVKVNNPVFIDFPQKPAISNIFVCCDSKRLATTGLHDCPLTRDLLEFSCSVEEDDFMFIYPPCPPNNKVCRLPLD